MAEDGKSPILNPVLALRREARRASVTGGGKQAKDIRVDRLGPQQRKLVADLRKIQASPADIVSFGGMVRLVARMFGDSLATSFTPASLLSSNVGCQLVVPVFDGYVFEVALNRLHELIGALEDPISIPTKVDISRIAAIEPFGEADILRGRQAKELWKNASLAGEARLFMVWLSPIRNARAREELMLRVEQFREGRVLLPTKHSVRLYEGDGAEEQRLIVPNEPNSTSISAVLRRYRNTGHGAASIRVSSLRNLSAIIASGVVHRIEPVQAIRVTAAGEGREPGLPPPDVAHQPIVGIIDGGITARSYSSAQAWRAPDFVPTGKADTVHGNKVTSIVVQGHAWNGNLDLPKLFCRFGVAQAVAKSDVTYELNPEQLVSYVDRVIASQPQTRVWNLSFNEIDPIDPNAVSYLGHALTGVARKHNALLVISAGNRLRSDDDRIQPPADCEAALVVGGRRYDDKGLPGEPCLTCAPGLGPEGMLKPDVSWYSPLRVIGGSEDHGSSFPTGLVSALSAHTFENLLEPTPDAVRALLINTTEQIKHDRRLGWGTPYQGREPWLCKPGAVTMLWTSKLRTGTAYYWEGIPIPAELTRDGKLFGKASLTAILKPLTRDEGDANYFMTRVQVSLQYRQGDKWQSLLGSMKEDTEAEQSARDNLAKWYPVRCHRENFSKGRGRSYDPDTTMRVFARVFARDLYQLGITDPADLGEHEVAFALTLENNSNDSALYNAMRTTLGTFVESAVVETDVEIQR